MTTQKNNSSTFTTSEIAILKGCALKQYNCEAFFLVTEEDEIIAAYEGTEEEARAQFAADIEGTEEADIDANFAIFCSNNLTQVDPIEDDEEKENYMVLTNEEADEKCADYIKSSLWAFNAGFIIDHSELPYEAEEMISSFCADKCEGANDTVEALIKDMDEFIADAVSADGRGHFMSSYDGNENEETVEGVTFYIYRMN